MSVPDSPPDFSAVPTAAEVSPTRVTKEVVFYYSDSRASATNAFAANGVRIEDGDTVTPPAYDGGLWVFVKKNGSKITVPPGYLWCEEREVVLKKLKKDNVV